jgi:hypothetical protein
MNGQWTGDGNRFTTEAARTVLLVQYNLHDYWRFQFYKSLLRQPTRNQVLGAVCKQVLADRYVNILFAYCVISFLTSDIM